MSQFAEPSSTQCPSTTISFEWSNGGGVSQMRQPRLSTCHHIARDAQCTNGRLFLPGKMMSTRTPRNAARFNAVISAGSGRKYGVTNLHGRLRLGQRRQQRPGAVFQNRRPDRR